MLETIACIELIRQSMNVGLANKCSLQITPEAVTNEVEMNFEFVILVQNNHAVFAIEQNLFLVVT